MVVLECCITLLRVCVARKAREVQADGVCFVSVSSNISPFFARLTGTKLRTRSPLTGGK